MHLSAQNKEDEGLIFNIQRFSIHDGPGIRTTVFMKGCPLKCRWCSNPESQSFFPALLVRDINCVGCGACRPACSPGAISFREGKRQIDRQICNNCLECVKNCSYQSLNTCGQYLKMEDVIREVLRDEAFYKNSGGGLTVSGGEPLRQAEFTLLLLAQCKKKGIHTALDTTGYAPGEIMEKVLEFADLVLFDIKHLDPVIHLQATGVSNSLIIENFKKIPERIAVWLRIPLIAGFNDSAEHILKITALNKVRRIQKISLLPYHEGGKSKCEQIGLPYFLPDAAAPGAEHLEKLKKIIEEQDIEAAIGN